MVHLHRLICHNHYKCLYFFPLNIHQAHAIDHSLPKHGLQLTLATNKKSFTKRITKATMASRNAIGGWGVTYLSRSLIVSQVRFMNT